MGRGLALVLALLAWAAGCSGAFKVRLGAAQLGSGCAAGPGKAGQGFAKIRRVCCSGRGSVGSTQHSSRTHTTTPQLGPRPKAAPGLIVRYRSGGVGIAAAVAGTLGPKLIAPSLNMYTVDISDGTPPAVKAAELSKLGGELGACGCGIGSTQVSAAGAARGRSHAKGAGMRSTRPCIPGCAGEGGTGRGEPAQLGAAGCVRVWQPGSAAAGAGRKGAVLARPRLHHPMLKPAFCDRLSRSAASALAMVAQRTRPAVLPGCCGGPMPRRPLNAGTAGTTGVAQGRPLPLTPRPGPPPLPP